MIARRFRSVHLMLALGALCLVAAVPTAKLDLDAWRELPVHHEGRVMPLDTFARSAIDVICDRMNPELDLKGSVPKSDFNSDKFKPARELFPDGKPRRFKAAELLLSWLAEPEKWEHVPFLAAPYDELREVLEAPIKNEENVFLKYVSPADVEESDKLRELIRTAAEKQQAAKIRQETFEPTAVERRARELLEAYNLYRQLTYRPLETESGRNRFVDKTSAAAENWVKLRDSLTGLAMASLGDKQLSESIEQVDSAIQEVFQTARTVRFPLKDVEPTVAKLSAGADTLASYFGTAQQRLLREGRDQMDAKQYESFRKILGRLAGSTRKLAQQAREMHISLYDPGEPLRIVPALNAAALEKDRDVADDAQPWAALQVILYGSDELLKDYPKSQVFAVRTTFDRVTSAYRNRGSSQRGEELSKALDKFAVAVRGLGEATSKQRETLPIKGRDDDLMAYTAYPDEDATHAEVHYNTVDPFMWSWVISLGAALCFSLAFGVIRKPMFWAGLGLLALCLAWSIYGFYLRVIITQWAPVTGMYETVVYVPTFIALLSLWFTLLPMIWPGLKLSWQWSAFPFTWESKSAAKAEIESKPTRPHAKQIAEEAAGPDVMNLVLAVPRIGLMALLFWVLTIAPYAAGDRTVINLLPVTDVGSSMPNGNALLTWFVGLCVLLPTLWYLPRVVVTLLAAVMSVPMTLRGQMAGVLPQVYNRKVFALAAAFVCCLLFMIAWYSPVLEAEFKPLNPVLRDNFWLTIHVLTIVSSYGAGLLAWGLGNIAMAFYLFGKYRPPMYSRLAPAVGSLNELRPAEAGDDNTSAFQPRPPEATGTLANYIYKVTQLAVLLLAAGTILGGLWADVSWGRFWGWDPKEVWALISLLTYLAILHGRYAGWFGNFGLAVGSVFGASAIAFSWYGVNFVLGAGLHSYGFGDGGQAEVFTGIALNWIFVGAAATRYWLQMNAVSPVEMNSGMGSSGGPGLTG